MKAFLGDILVGIWYCPNGHSLFPRQIEDYGDCEWKEHGWICPDCGQEMKYDEEA